MSLWPFSPTPQIKLIKCYKSNMKSTSLTWYRTTGIFPLDAHFFYSEFGSFQSITSIVKKTILGILISTEPHTFNCVSITVSPIVYTKKTWHDETIKVILYRVVTHVMYHTKIQTAFEFYDLCTKPFKLYYLHKNVPSYKGI